MTTFRAQFPSAFTSVGQARRAVASFAEICGFGLVEISDIVLAVGEACNNAAEHGHVDSGQFSVECTYDGGTLAIEICDHGAGFDFEHADRFSSAVAAEIRSAHRGRGMLIMRSLMDVVSYSVTDRGTTVRLEKNRSARGAGEAASELRGVNSGGPR